MHNYLSFATGIALENRLWFTAYKFLQQQMLLWLESQQNLWIVKLVFVFRINLLKNTEWA